MRPALSRTAFQRPGQRVLPGEDEYGLSTHTDAPPLPHGLHRTFVSLLLPLAAVVLLVLTLPVT